MPPNGAWSDLLDLWLEYSEASQSPLQFRLWSGLQMIGASLERRVWAQTGQYTTYPNLYVLLVGSPGVGKHVLDDARELWTAVAKPGTKDPAFFTASDSVTRATLTDELAKAKRIFLPPKGEPLEYHALTIISEEFQVLLPAYDREFISRLNRLFMCPREHTESRRTGNVREMKIELPYLSMLAATQPAYLSDTFPENAWATGISRRILMIYAAEGPLLSIFTEPPDRRRLEAALLHRFEQLSQLFGHARWTEEAALLVASFDQENQEWMRGIRTEPLSWPIPTHSRLVYYNRSRTMSLIKLSVICAVAARCELIIRKEDVERALGYLLGAEKLMPDIFREMRGQSDREVMEELHQYATAMYVVNRESPKPLRTFQLIDFLSYRVPSEKVSRILAIVEQANLLSRVAGTDDQWIPKPSFNMKGIE